MDRAVPDKVLGGCLGCLQPHRSCRDPYKERRGVQSSSCRQRTKPGPHSLLSKALGGERNYHELVKPRLRQLERLRNSIFLVPSSSCRSPALPCCMKGHFVINPCQSSPPACTGMWKDSLEPCWPCLGGHTRIHPRLPSQLCPRSSQGLSLCSSCCCTKHISVPSTQPSKASPGLQMLLRHRITP